MKQPETPIVQDHEQEALQEHARKLTVWAAYRRAQKFLREIEQEERGKQRLLKISLIICFALSGTVALMLLVMVLANLSPHG